MRVGECQGKISPLLGLGGVRWEIRDGRPAGQKSLSISNSEPFGDGFAREASYYKWDAARLLLQDQRILARSEVVMGHESIHDEDLPYLQAVMRHEPHADEAFYDRFCSFLERLSAQKVDRLYNRLPQDERQDIVGEAVNHALNHLLSHPERFDPSRGTVRGLLIRVAFNRVKDLVRAATRRSRYDVPPPPYEEGNDEIRPPSHRSHERPAEDRILDNETEADNAEALHKAILELSPLQRQAISLQLLRSFSIKEIARALDMSENAAESLIRRARARLHSLLAERAQ